MKKIFIFLVFIISNLPLYSQQVALPKYTPHLTDMVWNRKNINPAFAGESRTWDIQGQIDRQWIGYKNGPFNTYLSCEKYFDKIHSGMGVQGAFGRCIIGYGQDNY